MSQSQRMDIKSWDPKFYMAVFQGEFDTDLEKLGIDSWLATDPTLPLTYTVGVIDWLDATKDMRVTPIGEITEPSDPRKEEK